ncbi:conjugal transfer protein [Mycobacterium tuberculosis]|nr:conjugal transfer protein [Mycobacterium tuberculosis]
MLGDTEVLANLRVLQTELTGAGILEPLLSADGTTDVLVTAPDSVWVDDGNGLRRSQIRFADESAVRRLAQRLALAAGRRLDDAQPWVDGQLTGIGVGGFAVRLHAVLPPVATQGTCLSLRVLRPATQDLAALAAAGGGGGRDRPRGRRAGRRHRHRPAGIPRVRRNRCREDNVAGSDVGRRVAR